MRFDAPIVGLATIQAIRIAGATVLSIDAGKTLIFDRDAFFASANEAGIMVAPAGPQKAQKRQEEHKVVKAAVIGVGHSGKHHARILAAMPGRLAGRGGRRESRSRVRRSPVNGTRAFGNSNEIPDKLDVVVIAVPDRTATPPLPCR